MTLFFVFAVQLVIRTTAICCAFYISLHPYIPPSLHPYIASSPSSEVRIRIARSTSDTNIFPSPIFPVLALAIITSIQRSIWSSTSTISSLTLGKNVYFVFCPSIGFGMIFLTSITFYFCHGQSLYTDFS
jgi:hypothetical protein